MHDKSFTLVTSSSCWRRSARGATWIAAALAIVALTCAGCTDTIAVGAGQASADAVHSQALAVAERLVAARNACRAFGHKEPSALRHHRDPGVPTERTAIVKAQAAYEQRRAFFATCYPVFSKPECGRILRQELELASQKDSPAAN
jgi:hypothetical protein